MVGVRTHMGMRLMVVTTTARICRAQLRRLSQTVSDREQNPRRRMGCSGPTIRVQRTHALTTDTSSQQSCTATCGAPASCPVQLCPGHPRAGHRQNAAAVAVSDANSAVISHRCSLSANSCYAGSPAEGSAASCWPLTGDMWAKSSTVWLPQVHSCTPSFGPMPQTSWTAAVAASTSSRALGLSGMPIRHVTPTRCHTYKRAASTLVSETTARLSARRPVIASSC